VEKLDWKVDILGDRDARVELMLRGIKGHVIPNYLFHIYVHTYITLLVVPHQLRTTVSHYATWFAASNKAVLPIGIPIHRSMVGLLCQCKYA